MTPTTAAHRIRRLKVTQRVYGAFSCAKVVDGPACRASEGSREGVRAKPVRIRRCPATVRPHTGDEPGRLPFRPHACPRNEGQFVHRTNPFIPGNGG